MSSRFKWSSQKSNVIYLNVVGNNETKKKNNNNNNNEKIKTEKKQKNCKIQQGRRIICILTSIVTSDWVTQGTSDAANKCLNRNNGDPGRSFEPIKFKRIRDYNNDEGSPIDERNLLVKNSNVFFPMFVLFYKNFCNNSQPLYGQRIRTFS